MELHTKTEQNILISAEKVFYKKGKQGTSMQDIADEAGITRTSLNYYYRSKDKLFEAVFKNAMNSFMPKVSELMSSNDPLMDQFPALVENIIDLFIEKPQIPVFVLQELSSNPSRLPQIWMELGINPEKVVRKMKEEKAYAYLKVDPRQLVISVISMCIFPFAAKPILVPLMFEEDENAFIEAMQQRKLLIPKMIENLIKNN